MSLFTQEGFLFLLRWIHFLAGITWIGILYYLNFVQTPYFATDLGGQARSAMMRGLVPNALWWFRWGAMVTYLTGWLIVITHMVTGTGSMPYYALILTGGTLGSFMWFNVWFVIMPRQRLAIASAEAVAAGGQANPEAAKQAPIAGRASRTNTLFSIPMLFFMGAARHLTLVNEETPKYGAFFAIMLLLVVLFEANIFKGTATTQKWLATVSSTIHTGLILTAVLYCAAEFLL
ncbi:MAG: hypothetical protein FJ108_16140 [Deltaproteobacteria bacterium]|nr:hypothetical protein [Deltaproteobacteria bacterium]